MKTEMDFEDLMEEAYQLPNGPAKLGFLEEAARVADVNGMVEEAYEARSEIVDVATFCGYPMKALIAFSWQLGKFDQQPEQYDEETLLWSYKWILGKMPDFRKSRARRSWSYWRTSEHGSSLMVTVSVLTGTIVSASLWISESWRNQDAAMTSSEH